MAIHTEAFASAREQLLAKAGRIRDPARRQRFLTVIADNARTLALASSLAARQP